MREALKSSSGAKSNAVAEDAVDNLRILIADAYRSADYDLVNRLERILKKVEVLARNLEAAGKGGGSQITPGEQAPFQASFGGLFGSESGLKRGR